MVILNLRSKLRGKILIERNKQQQWMIFFLIMTYANTVGRTIFFSPDILSGKKTCIVIQNKNFLVLIFYREQA